MIIPKQKSLNGVHSTSLIWERTVMISCKLKRPKKIKKSKIVTPPPQVRSYIPNFFLEIEKKRNK